MSLLNRNGNRANRRAAAERFAALRAEAAAPVEYCVGDIVDITRDDGRTDNVRVIGVWRSEGIPMLTVAHNPRGLSTFKVRADSVVTDEAPGGEL
jgi:hypothetical protein